MDIRYTADGTAYLVVGKITEGDDVTAPRLLTIPLGTLTAMGGDELTSHIPENSGSEETPAEYNPADFGA